MRRSSHAEPMSRATTIRIWPFASADFAPTHGNAVSRTKVSKGFGERMVVVGGRR